MENRDIELQILLNSLTLNSNQKEALKSILIEDNTKALTLFLNGLDGAQNQFNVNSFIEVFHYCLIYQKEKCAHLFLSKNIDVNLKNQWGEIALHCVFPLADKDTVNSSKMALISLIIQKTDNINSVDKKGRKVLSHPFISHVSDEYFKLLLDKGLILDEETQIYLTDQDTQKEKIFKNKI